MATYRNFGDQLRSYTSAQLADLVTRFGPSGTQQAGAIMPGTRVFDSDAGLVKFWSSSNSWLPIDQSGAAGSAPIVLTLTPSLQYLSYPSVNFKATLQAGSTGTTVVAIVDQNNAELGRFSLDTVGNTISSGFLTNLAGQAKYTVISGTGTFIIQATITA